MASDPRLAEADPWLRPTADPLDRLVAWCLVHVNLGEVSPVRALPHLVPQGKDGPHGYKEV